MSTVSEDILGKKVWVTSHAAKNSSHGSSFVSKPESPARPSVSAASHIHTASVWDVLPRKQSSRGGEEARRTAAS